MSAYSDSNMKENLHAEIKESLDEAADHYLKQVIQMWDTIYGTSSQPIVRELTSDLAKCFQEFWEQQRFKLNDIKNDFLDRINDVGKEAVHLEKALGLEQQVTKVPNKIPLIQMEEQLQSLLESYQGLKNDRLKEYFQLQNKEKDLCTVLDLKVPQYEREVSDGSAPMGQYVPSSDDMEQFKGRIHHLEQLKEQLEYEFEEAKAQLRDLMEECNIQPLSKRERFAFDEAELSITKRNLELLKDSVTAVMKKKEDMIAESDYLREQIDIISKKMFKDPIEIREFLSGNQRHTEAVINTLKEKLKALKEERKNNLKELIANSRKVLIEWWDRCCYTEAQRQEFKPFEATRQSEEVLEFLELEIEKLEHFYNNYKQVFVLAEEHQELWDRMLHLEDQANNKDRLFNNRGGCLLKEEKERKLIQKKVPAVKSKLMTLLDSYKEETGKDFLYYGEPLQHEIEMKEQMRENSKHTERILRRAANVENLMVESRHGAQALAGVKRRAAATPQNADKTKSRRVETAALSSASSKSTVSSASSTARGTLVRREEDIAQVRSYLTVRTPNHNMATPSRRNQMPAASTPQNGSLSYESFQEHIEKSKFLAHNSTRNEQRVLRPKNLNQTRVVVEKPTPFRTPKTPGKTFTKTPSKTPSKIPFRIATGSKIPSQVPPMSPRRKPALSTTKLPIIF